MTDEIQGPLGIWPWPILNALVKISNGRGDGVSVESYNVVRDSQGRIENVEVVKGLGDDG